MVSVGIQCNIIMQRIVRRPTAGIPPKKRKTPPHDIHLEMPSARVCARCASAVLVGEKKKYKFSNDAL